MKKKVLLICMTIIFFVLFIYSLTNIIIWYFDNKHTESIVNELIEGSIEIEKKENTETKEETTTQTINFDYLTNKNKDTVGWIKVNNTNINYPFVQAKDNKYYLKHSFDKKYTDAGWVFLDYRNNINELDKNTIIYAHARKDKSMFGTLKNTLKKNWYNNKSNHIITLTTKTKELKFQVFSTYHVETEDYYITTKFKNDEEYIKFLNTIKKRSIHNYNVSLNKDDYVLTLSSCFNEKEKVVLHAKLIN